MRLNKFLGFSILVSSIGLFAVDGPTVKNMSGPWIKVHLSDNNGNLFESREAKYQQSVTMTKCVPGRLLLVEWGEKESDGRPKVVGAPMKNCGSKVIFTSSYEFIKESNDWGDEEGSKDWNTAKRTCESKGMRLPSKAELIAVQKAGASGWKRDWYWTNETISDKQAIHVDVSTGSSEAWSIDSFKTSLVRCHTK